jgi:hypothetical protein
VRYEADHRGDRAALQERAQAEAADSLDRNADVELARILELAEVRVGEALGQQRDDGLRSEPVLVDRNADALILIVIGEPTDRNRSEACFSDIRLNMRSSDMGVSELRGVDVKLGDQAYDPGQGIANTAERMKRQVYRPEHARSRAQVTTRYALRPATGR